MIDLEFSHGSKVQGGRQGAHTACSTSGVGILYVSSCGTLLRRARDAMINEIGTE